MHTFQQRTISELVTDNAFFAQALHYLGIEYADYEAVTIEKLSAIKGIDIATLEKNFLDSSKYLDLEQPKLAGQPLSLVIEYLRHAHHLFIKYKLPYMGTLVKQISASVQEGPIADLSFVFPLFAEDFIKHIYHEEDTLFTYVLALEAAKEGKTEPLLKFGAKNSTIGIAALHDEHEGHDDEMGSIRKLTSDYQYTDESLLGIKVLFQELKAFEKELRAHAAIENHILLPKALELEKAVKEALPSHA